MMQAIKKWLLYARLFMYRGTIKQRQVSAFTMMEVTVSMLVSAIVITVTFTAYRIISNSYEHFSNQSRAFGVLIRLDEWLKKDFLQAEIVLQTRDGIIILKDGAEIRYRFFPGEIIRDGVVSDTFQLAVPAWFGYFEGMAVSGLSDSEKAEVVLQDISKNEAARIDRLDLTIRFRDENVPYSYHKMYSSHNLMQRKTDALY
ncbi:MAG: PulJ/GspJ family protein [Sphingobacteriaceae bacterium]